MYTICSIGPSPLPLTNLKLKIQCFDAAPAFIASALLEANLYAEGARFLMISTEGGSITLRTKEEGGGNYAHHGSKVRSSLR